MRPWEGGRPTPPSETCSRPRPCRDGDLAHSRVFSGRLFRRRFAGAEPDLPGSGVGAAKRHYRECHHRDMGSDHDCAFARTTPSPGRGRLSRGQSGAGSR